MELIRRRNELAFLELYNRYHASLFHFSMKFLHSEALAKDAVHDVFVKLWNNSTELPAITSVKSYLFTACKNTILHTLDRATRELRIKNEIGKQMMRTEPSVEATFINAEQEALFQEAVAQLPPKRREVFMLCRVEEKSYEEVSKILNISVSTVNDHMVKATKALKNYLQQHTDLPLPLLLLLCAGY